MPRAPRVEFAGAIYHVMNRGNHLEPIFRDRQDRGIFVRTLSETCTSAGWVVHSFVLMPNHYHLLIETSRPTLIKGMQYLNSTYTQRYNVRHKTRGHLFQGRYKALLVDADAPGYFLTVSDYIHLNPARVKRNPVRTLKELVEDEWSSAGWLAGSCRGWPEWLRWERVYGELGLRNWKSRSRREYRQYLSQRLAEGGADNEGWKKIRRNWCVGSPGFVERMKEKLDELARKPRKEESWAGEAVEEREERLAGIVFKIGLKRLGYRNAEDAPAMDRYLLARLIRHRTKVSVEWISRQMGLRTRAGMSSCISLAGKQIEQDRKTAAKWNCLFLLDYSD